MGRRIWVVTGEKNNNFCYDCRVVSFKRFLPAGPVAIGEGPARDGIRANHLIQLNTDPGAMRTLSVAEIRLRDPRKKSRAKQRAKAESSL